MARGAPKSGVRAAASAFTRKQKSQRPLACEAARSASIGRPVSSAVRHRKAEAKGRRSAGKRAPALGRERAYGRKPAQDCVEYSRLPEIRAEGPPRRIWATSPQGSLQLEVIAIRVARKVWADCCCAAMAAPRMYLMSGTRLPYSQNGWCGTFRSRPSTPWQRRSCASRASSSACSSSWRQLARRPPRHWLSSWNGSDDRL